MKCKDCGSKLHAECFRRSEARAEKARAEPERHTIHPGNAHGHTPVTLLTLLPRAIIERSKLAKWDDRWLQFAETVAGWSKDPSTKVGAVIVGHQHRLLGIGYNGFPRDVVDSLERYADKMTKYKLIVHSEANAILNSHGSVSDATLYTTKFPCSDCAKLVIQSGISRIFTPLPSGDGVWAEDASFSDQMFREAAITLHFYSS